MNNDKVKYKIIDGEAPHCQSRMSNGQGRPARPRGLRDHDRRELHRDQGVRRHRRQHQREAEARPRPRHGPLLPGHRGHPPGGRRCQPEQDVPELERAHQRGDLAELEVGRGGQLLDCSQGPPLVLGQVDQDHQGWQRDQVDPDGLLGLRSGSNRMRQQQQQQHLELRRHDQRAREHNGGQRLLRDLLGQGQHDQLRVGEQKHFLHEHQPV